MLDKIAKIIPNNKYDENSGHKTRICYAMPMRDLVLFPGSTTSILIGRRKSINAVIAAKKNNLPVFAITQNKDSHEKFLIKNLYKTGVLCQVVEYIKISDNSIKAILKAYIPANIKKIISDSSFYSCEVDVVDQYFNFNQEDGHYKKLLTLVKGCAETFAKFATYNKKITSQDLVTLSKFKSPYDIAFFIAPYLASRVPYKQYILEEKDIILKLTKLYELLHVDFDIAQAEAEMSKKIQEKVSKNQKDAYLNEQLKHIKKELGQDEQENEINEFKQKAAKLKLPLEVKEKFNTELSKLEKMHSFSAEAGVIRNYLDLICQLPWFVFSKLQQDLNKAKEILDENHYSLDKIKERILEFIAVTIKTKANKGPILCFVGPPGVGKTSLAKSIAQALNRKYSKVSLGGVRDESEIRGHRRTYIGSMPGRIIQSMKKVKTSNPLILLDEIDKTASDMRGDPSSALLEVLDPSQNSEFSDHFLEVDYDLSNVMFIATANDINSIPLPLKDRMEIIQLSGYIESEKLNIAKNHLIKNQLQENGLSEKEFAISNNAIIKLIRNYTFEAGVRNLNRQIANLARKCAKEIVLKNCKNIKFTENNLKKYAGSEKFDYNLANKKDEIGIATGMAYTQFGGDLLSIEVISYNGDGKVKITGKLGDVMKESAEISHSLARLICQNLNIGKDYFKNNDFHIHVPEGATPKDGPSAGIALTCAIMSQILNLPIKKDIAMTGEVTLAGKVLPIGGLKEKLLAAVRGNIKLVIIPEKNKKDIDQLPSEIQKNLEIRALDNIDDVLKLAIIGYDKIADKNLEVSSSNENVISSYVKKAS